MTQIPEGEQVCSQGYWSAPLFFLLIVTNAVPSN